MKNSIKNICLAVCMTVSIDIAAQVRKEAYDTLVQEQQHFSKTIFANQPLDDIIVQIENNTYEHLSNTALMESLLYNQDIAYLGSELITQIYGPDAMQDNQKIPYIMDNIHHIIRYLLLERGLLVYPQSDGSFVHSSVTKKTTIDSQDPYLRILLPNAEPPKTLQLYYVKAASVPFVGTVVLESIVICEDALQEEYQEIVHMTNDTTGGYERFGEAVYANEKTHIYWNSSYKENIHRHNTVVYNGIPYTMHEVSEMTSDAVSMQNDPRLLYVCIRNMLLYADVFAMPSKVPQYTCSSDIMIQTLQDYGIDILYDNQGYKIKKQHYKTAEEAAKYIYSSFDVSERMSVIQSYQTHAAAVIKKIPQQ